MLVHLKAACGGDLDRVKRVVRLGGFIAAPSEFNQHAQVMNGASDLAVAIFGEAGRHARSTIGVPSLPADAAVEVEGMFELPLGRLACQMVRPPLPSRFMPVPPEVGAAIGTLAAPGNPFVSHAFLSAMEEQSTNQ